MISALVSACTEGDLDTVQRLVRSNVVDVDSAEFLFLDGGVSTPLCCAARNGHRAIVEFLLASGAARNRNEAALSIAAGAGHAAVVEALVAAGFHEDEEPRPRLQLKCKTPLDEACENGHLAVVDVLVAAGVPIGDGLMYAIKEGHVDVVRRLLASRVDINAPKWSETPLMAATSSENVELMHILIEAGADCNVGSNGTYPIIYADTAASVDLLVAAGADINIVGRNDTALSAACRSGRLDFARYLISVGADVNAPNMSGATALMLAFGFDTTTSRRSELVTSSDLRPFTSENLQVVKMLLDAGARVRDVDHKGNSVLHYAAVSGSARCIPTVDYCHALEIVLAAGASEIVDMPNSSGNTAIFVAARSGSVSVINVLTNAGADLCIANNDGETPLMVVPVSTQGDTVSVTQLLLDSGARAGLNAQDATGKTALMRAVRELRFSPQPVYQTDADKDKIHTLEAVNTLIRAGADVNVIDNDGSTALMEVYRLPPREHRWSVPLEESTSLAYFRGTAEVLLAAGANENINTRDKDGRTALLLAASVAAVDDCKALVAVGADATERDARGSTVLIEAIRGIARNVECSYSYRNLDAASVDVATLLSILANAGGSQVINACNNNGHNALFVAMGKFWREDVNCGLVEILRALLSAGADVSMMCNGSTALMFACSQTPPDGRSHIRAGTGTGVSKASGQNLHQQVVEVLIQHSAAETINLRDAEGYTALMLARNARIVQSLIDAGADVHALANNGLNALTLICFWQSPCPEIMRILIAAGSSFINSSNDDGDSLVMMFIKSCGRAHLPSGLILEVLRILVDTGVDMRARNNQGKSVLLVAVEIFYNPFGMTHEVLKGLISACDAEVLNMCDNNGKTLFAAMSSRGHMIPISSDMLLFMVRHGLDVTGTSRTGETVLMRILWSGFSDAAAIEALLQSGASETINHICSEGRCALALAISPISNQPPEIFLMLIQYGADLSIPAVSKSAFTMAFGYTNRTRLLLHLGADVNARDENGQTVILRRLEPGNEAVHMLIDAGARLMDTDNYGNTSVMYLFTSFADCDITAEIEMIRAEIDRYHH